MSPINTPPTAPEITHHQTFIPTPLKESIIKYAIATNITGAKSVPDLKALAGAFAD